MWGAIRLQNLWEKFISRCLASSLVKHQMFWTISMATAAKARNLPSLPALSHFFHLSPCSSSYLGSTWYCDDLYSGSRTSDFWSRRWPTRRSWKIWESISIFIRATCLRWLLEMHSCSVSGKNSCPWDSLVLYTVQKVAPCFYLLGEAFQTHSIQSHAARNSDFYPDSCC